MRIQHNISAMNSYRNFSTNNSNLSKNLEKLSTGYKINRAGDDAAGLAISEKMRAQITGLEGATKNAKDGISLIQTAEGALTEVHSMLNRMTTLAEQSANGTYDDSVDRQQLQKEVEALKSEIDRIADSTNYNGIKLLDGSLSGAGGLKGNVNLNDTKAVAGSATTNAFDDTKTKAANGVTAGDKLSYHMAWEEDGVKHEATVNFTVNTEQNALIAEDGTQYTLANATKATKTEISGAVLGELQKNKDVTNSFDVSVNSDALKFESKVKGTKGAVLTNTDTKMVDKETGAITSFGADQKTNTYAKDSLQKVDLKNLAVLTATNITKSGDAQKAVEDNTFEIDGKKFVLVGKDESYEEMKKYVGDDVDIIQLTKANTVADTLAGSKFKGDDADNNKKIAAELSRVTGRDFSVAGAPGTVETAAGIAEKDILLDNKGGLKLSKTGKALDLQIGDTADSFNKMSVAVKDMHVKSIGLADVDISNQQGAAEALNKIKTAINNVSDQRGSLGALQNRLDHTLNNLGVMRENIQNAESLIRDTDIAEEMIASTKNNILNQSAQARLAPANQLPHGELQLLG
jgi:flagellin